MLDDHPQDNCNTEHSGADDLPAPVSELEFDPEMYRDDLTELELSKEQENAVLEALWNIMSAFVHLGWGVDSVQLLFPALFEKLDPDSKELLDSNEKRKD